MINIDIDIDRVNSKFIVKNNSGIETPKINFFLVDKESNLNVYSFWMVINAYRTMEYGCSKSYLDHTKGFILHCYDENLNRIYSKEFQFNSKINTDNFFYVKHCFDFNYWSWHNLVHEPEYNLNFENNDIVYDLGANVGVFSRFCLSNNVKQVYAFEPDIENYNCMCKTFCSEKNINLYQKAIFNKKEIKKFFIFHHSVANSFYINSDKSIDVEAINLEEFIKENNLLLPTIIKSDIEGAEYDFLSGCTDAFFDTIHTFILEFHFNVYYNYSNLADILKRFLLLGYNVSMTKMTKLETNTGTLIFKKNI